MSVKPVLVLIPYEVEPNEVKQYMQVFQDFRVSYQTRYVSAETAPEQLDEILVNDAFASMILCWTNDSSFLVHYVSGRTDLPVLSFGSGHVHSSILLAMRIVASQRSELREELKRERKSHLAKVVACDREQADKFMGE